MFTVWRNDGKSVFPYRVYDLRHAFAARLWSAGGNKLDIYTAARIMGHSVLVHERTYRSHISHHLVALTAMEALN